MRSDTQKMNINICANSHQYECGAFLLPDDEDRRADYSEDGPGWASTSEMAINPASAELPAVER